MPLFFTRRRFLRGRFNDAVDAKTRHLDVTYANALSERWDGAFIDRTSWVDRALARSRNGHVLVFVHGYNTVQRGMIGTLRKLEQGLGGKFSGSVVGFDWPSDGDWYAYSWDSKDIEAVADTLVDDCLLPLMMHAKCRSVSVMAHSRGCFLTLRALTKARKLGGNRKLANLMFVSADIRMPDVKLGTTARAHIHRTARRFTNYYSPDDVILQLSQGINGSRPRLGRAGLPNPVAPPGSDVRCDYQYRHEHGTGWRPRLSHNWWFSSPGFQRDVAHSLAGKAASALTTRKRIRDSADHLLWVR